MYRNNSICKKWRKCEFHPQNKNYIKQYKQFLFFIYLDKRSWVKQM